MLYVSIFVELLRSRPALTVAIAAVAQAALWTLVPSLFYSGPPGNLPFVLAVGNELQLGSWLGPPLAFWLAELAFLAAGDSLIGVYLLSQICVVATYWAAFSLGRSIVGAQHAAMAMLLMVGIFAFTVPTPDFGPATLTMALWAVILLHYWRAVGEGQRAYWIALAIEIGLLLLTSHAGLLLLAMLAFFTAGNAHARAAMRSSDPWLASIMTLVVLLPYLVWLWEAGDGRLMPLQMPESPVESLFTWLWQVAAVLAVHAGLALLVLLVAGWRWGRDEPSPVIVRAPVARAARQFVLFFAVVPPLAATIVAVAGWPASFRSIAPMVVLSGLAVIVVAGDGIELRRQHLVIPAWFGLLLAPPVLVVLALAMLPWFGVDLHVNKPVKEVARFFAESFERRTGTPLSIVAGDPRTAALISLAAPSRPSLFLDATPERTPWLGFDDVRKKGAIVIWPTTDTAGTPPPDIQARFPDLIADATRVFARPISGRLPVLRYGWAVIRPRTQAEAKK